MSDKIISPLLKRIEAFCKRKSMSQSRFGRNATGNPSALPRLRKGIYSNVVVGKIEAYLDANK